MIRGVRRLVRLVVPYRKDLSLAWSTIKGRKGGFAGSFVAIAAGSAVITACGILLMSGLGAGVTAERYSGAAVVLGAEQSFWLDETAEVRYSERVTLPAGKVAAVAEVPGVRSAIGDVSVEVSVLTPDGPVEGPVEFPVLGHGWSAAALGPFPVRDGREPAEPDEVVLDADLAERGDVSVDDTVRLVVDSIASSYRVVGIATPPGDGLDRQSAVFFDDDRATELSGRPDRVDAIGVLAEPGVPPGELAGRITAAVPDVLAHTGAERGDVEFLDVGDARSLVVESAASFGGTMVLIVVFVVASTLALSVRQRRRELALLRAIGATPKQINWMIGAEMTLVSSVGAVVGALPGVVLAFVMRGVFVFAGAMPADFQLEVGVLPILASLVLCMTSARLGGWLVARRVAKVSPVEALGDAAVEPKRLGWVRVVIGLALIPLGLLLTLGNPLVVPGDSAADTAATAVLLFVIAVGCLGPLLLRGAIVLFGSLLNRRSTASGFLAKANARANSRQLSSATTPLAMGVTLAAVQVFGASTAMAAAQDQVEEGLRADHVLTASAGAGLSPQVVEAVRDVPGVAVATPVARMRVLLTFPSEDSTATKVFAAQGVEPERLAETMDLAVNQGDLRDLRGETVALSRVVAETVRAQHGGTVELRLGDGTVITPKVVAIYENGLGFGDVTLPNDLVVAHTTAQVDAAVLVSAAEGTDQDALAGALREAVERYPTVQVGDREAFLAAPGTGGSGDWALNLLFQAVLLGYIAIAVVNTLVMATAARVREFAMLRLIGASRDQVRAMMNGEARIVVFSALLFGLLATVPPLIGISLGLTKSPVPNISVTGLVAIVALTVALSWGAIRMATRFAIRPAPVDAIGGRE